MDAAFELLASEGTSGTTVRAVCAHARLNPRYFYESFSDLDELLVATFDHVSSELRRRVGEAVATADDDDAAMRASVDATVRFVEEDRRRGRILYVEASGNDALNVRRLQAGAHLVQLVQQHHSRRQGTTHHPGVSRLRAAVLVGGLSEVLVSWLEGRIELGTDELIDDATEVLLAVWDATRRTRPSGRSAG